MPSRSDMSLTQNFSLIFFLGGGGVGTRVNALYLPCGTKFLRDLIFA